MPSPVELQPLLSQLHDIQLADPVGWWPPSQTLVGLFAGISAIIIGLTWYYLTHRRNNRYRREALEAFEQIQQQSSSPSEQWQAVNSLLKQVAITHYGRHRVAALTGRAWQQFLYQTALYIDQPDALSDCFAAIYQPNSQLDEATYQIALDYAYKWIKGHHK